MSRIENGSMANQITTAAVCMRLSQGTWRGAKYDDVFLCDAAGLLGEMGAAAFILKKLCGARGRLSLAQKITADQKVRYVGTTYTFLRCKCSVGGDGYKICVRTEQKDTTKK